MIPQFLTWPTNRYLAFPGMGNKQEERGCLELKRWYLKQWNELYYPGENMRKKENSGTQQLEGRETR